MTPEGKVKKECRAYLRSIGAYVFSPVQMGYGAATVDDLCCFAGKFVAIEYKRPGGGKLTDRQSRCLNEIWLAGGQIKVIDDVEGLRKWVKDYFLLTNGVFRRKENGRVCTE